MAAKGNNLPNDRSRVRFMLVDVDGTSADVQQLAQILAGAVKAPQTVIMQAPPLPPSLPAPIPAVPPASPQNGHAAASEPVPDHLVQPAAEQVTSVLRTQNGTKKKLRTPKLITELEVDSGPKSLKDYFTEQDPKEETKRYLAITQWLKQYRGIQEVGADHIYTCYRFLEKTVPDDVLSVFRSLKKNEWVEQGSKKGLFKITHIGENQLIKSK